MPARPLGTDTPGGLLQRANRVLQAEGAAAALVQIDAALHRFPDHGALLVRRGHILKLGQGPGAAADWLAGLEDRLPEDAARLYELASAQMAAGDLRASGQTLARLLTVQPDHGPGLRLQANLLMQTEGPVAALAMIDAALNRFPDCGPLLVRRGYVLKRLHGPQAAIDWLEALADRLPEDAARLYELASVQLSSADLPGAKRTLTRLLALRPDHASGLRLQTSLLMRTEGSAAALAQVDAALARLPHNGPLLLQRAAVLKARHGTRAAIDALESLAARLPADMGRLCDLAALRAEAGDLAGAMADCETVLGHPTGHVSTFQIRAGQALAGLAAPVPLPLLQRALVVLRKGVSRAAADARLSVQIRLAEAAPQECDLAAIVAEAIDPQAERSAAQMRRLLRLLEGQGRPDLAEPLLRHALAAGRLTPDLALLLLTRLVEHDGPEAARAVMGGLLARLKPDQAAQAEVQARLMIDGPEAAFACARAIGKAGPRNARLALQLGQLLSQTGRSALAERYLRRALRQWPGEKGLLTELMLACLRQGRPDRAGQMLAFAEDRGILGHEALRLSRRFLHQRSGDREEFLQSVVGQPDKLGATLRGAELQTLLLSPSRNPQVIGQRAALLDAPPRDAGPHFAPTINGTILNELKIGAHFDLARSHARFTAPAVAIIDAWAAARSPLPQGPSRIPPQIMQYWSQGRPDSAIAAVMASWQGLDGFGHVLFDRADAQLFLRRHLGPKWARALTLARNRAEEADFFRLCWLAQDGGLYVDADDRCLQHPGPLLSRAEGALFYREVSGSVGNNVMAAAPRHPVVMLAARLARDSLLRKESDSTWTKTGPGLLTRALAIRLKRTLDTDQPADVTLVPQHEITPFVQLHVPLPYKRRNTHWDRVGRSDPRTYAPLLQGLLDRAPA